MATEIWYGASNPPALADNYKDVLFFFRGQTTVHRGFAYEGKIMYLSKLRPMGEIEQWRFETLEDKQC